MNGTRLNRLIPVTAVPVLLAALVAGLLFASTAAAAPPVLHKVRYESGALRATWSLPPEVVASVFRVSTSPKLDSGGAIDGLETTISLRGDATSVTIRRHRAPGSGLYVLEPGVYYVQVEGSGRCATCSLSEYSEVRRVVVTDGFRKDANFTCQTYLPEFREFERQGRHARTPKQAAAIIEDTAALVRELVSNLRNNPTLPRGAKLRTFKAMLGANRRAAGYAQRSAQVARHGNLHRANALLGKAVERERVGERHARRLGLPECVRI